jgi:hypothetical protein
MFDMFRLAFFLTVVLAVSSPRLIRVYFAGLAKAAAHRAFDNPGTVFIVCLQTFSPQSPT